MQPESNSNNPCTPLDFGRGLDLIFDEFSARPALSHGNDILSYEELGELVGQYQSWLNKNSPREVILVRLDNTPDSVALILSSIRSQIIPLFCDPVWKEEEILHAMKRNGCRLFLTGNSSPFPGIPREKEESFRTYTLIQVASAGSVPEKNNLLNETDFCRFTSGTTGFSRCLQFPVSSFEAAGKNWQQAARIREEDRVYCLATLNNGLAFNIALLPVLLSGAQLILHKGSLIPGTIHKHLVKHHPTVLIAFPYVYSSLLEDNRSQEALSSLRLAISSAAPLAEAHSAGWKNRFGIPVCNYYGLAETGPCTFNDGEEPGSLGRPLPGVQIRIDSGSEESEPSGRIRIRTASMALAYLDAGSPHYSDKTDGDGFYLSSDNGYLSAHGNLFLLGRSDRMINIEGRKIDPVEVENQIRILPGVTDVLVRRKETSERALVAAFVEGTGISREQVVSICLKLSPYKMPQEIHIVEQFPRSSTGKISAALYQEQESSIVKQ